MEKTDPVSAGIASRETDRFRAEPANDEPQTKLFFGKNIEQPAVAGFFAMRKVHGGHD
jgi:hypothetical protein